MEPKLNVKLNFKLKFQWNFNVKTEPNLYSKKMEKNKKSKLEIEESKFGSSPKFKIEQNLKLNQIRNRN